MPNWKSLNRVLVFKKREFLIKHFLSDLNADWKWFKIYFWNLFIRTNLTTNSLKIKNHCFPNQPIWLVQVHFKSEENCSFQTTISCLLEHTACMLQWTMDQNVTGMELLGMVLPKSVQYILGRRLGCRSRGALTWFSYWTLTVSSFLISLIVFLAPKLPRVFWHNLSMTPFLFNDEGLP